MDMKSHATESAGHYSKLSELYDARAEACNDGDAAKMAKCDQKIAKVHAARAKHYEAMASDAAQKAISDELNKLRNEPLEPTRVSAIAPPDPTLRMIPRAGQPPARNADLDPEFANLFKTADGTEGPQ